MTAKSWTLTIEQDPDTGDLVLPFTDEILAELGWKEGDVLDWVDNQDGSWSLVKKKSKKNKKVVAKSKTI
jgi:bifunctional DNA-binding transcriptional regulator/antitoxin component of YhaV-PrlF toxin-antitoxin module